ncbi:c2 domain-containing protein [Ophiostoma piceae UAMH 11346]|uniref:C2 domain-containing protein n=1 Tax=Ophiostoma piceae (strain UAMH 11346) TaxID=1262450 RepID=S3CU04_OPHP1|nr:c2 domain-containing protein [Ophiostoma piceae UAMH 11346]
MSDPAPATAAPADDASSTSSSSSHKFPGGYDATPLPKPADGFPGYTVKFTFVRATNLPVADFDVLIGKASSDPFVHATLTTDVPTRHPGMEPLMVHRTRTIHKTTEPEWNEDWIVAGIPRSGFRLKCRLYDEDSADHDDRLGNVTVEVGSLTDDWAGVHQVYDVKKRMGSKRAYLIKAAASAISGGSITPTLELSIEILGKTDADKGGRVYTVGPTGFVRHFSPMIGRLTKTIVNKDEREDENGRSPEQHEQHEEQEQAQKAQKEQNNTLSPPGTANGRASQDASRASFSSARSGRSVRGLDETKKYDFQANEIQLHGPVPEQLYHRYVEFRPIIGRMFSAKGLRGHILNKALHKQHNRVYNYGRTTEYGSFPACSDQASLQFLKLAHFDEGGRIFTYMISIDGIFRFTETGKEFGIDMLSKHSMHSDVATYIAFSGEFFIRRLGRPISSSSPNPPTATHPAEDLPGGPPHQSPPHEPGYYQLVIDNDSGTYRPDKTLLPILQSYLEDNFPGLGVVAMHWEDETLGEMKEAQRRIKKHEGPGVQMVLNRNSSSSSISSSDESRLSDLGEHESEQPHKTKKQMAWDLLEDPSRIKDLSSAMFNHGISEKK